jgi:hypothetical protein
MARPKAPVAACIAFWFVAEAAAGNVFVEDRREQRDGSLPTFRSVGMLVHPQAGGGGTAFLVSRCHIVTAHHVAFPKERGLMGVDCAFEARMPSGPVLERQIDGSWLVVGLIQQSTGGTDKLLPSYSMAYRNQAVSVTAFCDALDGVLRAEAKRILAKPTR